MDTDHAADLVTADASPGVAEVQKANNRAFTLAAFGLFLPFLGILCGIAGIVMSRHARARGQEIGVDVDTNALHFSILVSVVWGVLWLLVLIPAVIRAV